MPYHLERSLFIPRPRTEVFPFFADAANLERITPPFLRFHILTPPPIDMRTGTLIDYQLRLYGLPLRWRTRIEACEPPDYFIDMQLSGPYKAWHHRHDFAEVPGGTEMRDRVDYDLPFGPFGAIARALFVRRSVEQIFDHRNKIISELFRR
jgi:ligand-binding SRPBCC domain-containing protein